MAAYSLVLRGNALEKKAEIVALQEGLAAANPLVDRRLLSQAAEDRRFGLAAQSRALRRGYPSALLAELGGPYGLTHRDLIERKRSALVEGVSFGGRDAHAATLAEYLIRLRGSPLLAEASAKEGAVEFFPGLGEGQRFTLTLGLK